MKVKSDWKGCPVRYAAAILGDAWTLVLLRDLLFRDKRRFRHFLTEESPASNILADRLARLESAGLITRHRDPQYGNQIACDLTEKGIALLPMFLAMIEWSAAYDPDTEAPEEFLAAYQSDRTGFARQLMTNLALKRERR